MAAPRPLQPAVANENESESVDPRVMNSTGAAPATSQALTLMESGHDDVDDEFAHLRVLLEAELNGGIPTDFSFTGLLSGSTDDTTHVLTTTDNMTQGLAATGNSDPLSDFDAFFDLEGASQQKATNATDESVLEGVGSQFQVFNSLLPQDFNANAWHGDPSVFPLGFEKASNVAGSNAIRFDPYAVEGLEGELPDLDSLTREFVRSAAVNLPGLGASSPGDKGFAISSLPPQPEFITSAPTAPAYTFIAVIDSNVTVSETNNTMGEETGSPLRAGLRAPNNTPVLEGAKPVVESGEDAPTRGAATNAVLGRPAMEIPALAVNMPGAATKGRTDVPAMDTRAVNAGPAGAEAANDGTNNAKKRGRKRKIDDGNDNTGTRSGNSKPPAPRKRAKKNMGYGPRVDASEPANETVINPLVTRAGKSTTSQAVVQQNSNDADSPKWTRKLPSLLDCTDPFMCPGPNLNCFHAFQNVGGYWLHVESVHGFKRAKLNKPEFKHIKDSFEPHLESWWIARGQDTTYQGTDRKQINARRRMKEGIRSNDPNYVEEVYVKTPAVRQAANKKAAKD